MITLAAAVALGLAGPVLAQAPISTAPASGPAAPQPTAAPLPLPPEDADDETPQGPQIALGPCGPEKVKADGTLETKPHGEVDAGVGTGGYRRIAGAVCQPLGQTGAVAVSISDTQSDGGRRRH
jgi:hypothetical protein